MAEMPPDDRARLHRAAASAATAVVYVAVASLAAKGFRALDLASQGHTATPLLLLPLVVWRDLAFAAACGLAAFALGRWLPRRGSGPLVLLLLLPTALLLPIDVLSHRLIGSSITFPQLMGWEGATPGDLDLLEASDLAFALCGLAASLALLALLWWWVPRRSRLVRLSRPGPLLALLGVSLGLAAVQHRVWPRDHGLAAPPLFTLVTSAVDRAALRARMLNRADWRALFRPERPDPSPTRAPRMAGPRARNLLIFLAEAIPYKHTSYGDPAADPTPHLRERQARHGVVFSRYHANWHNSIQALFTISCSQWPPLRANIVRTSPRIDCGSLSEILDDRGYAVGLFHGGRFSFYSKLSFFARRGFSIQRDAEDLSRKGGWEMHKWGIDDRAMVEATLEWIDTLPSDQPFAAVLIPITAHYPYFVPRNVARRFRGKRDRDRFRNAVAFQDQVFEALMRGLEERNLYRETAIFWVGDHGHSVEEPLRVTTSRRGYYQPDLHTPLVVISPSMFPETLSAEDRSSDRIGGHLDLAPTALDVLGLPPDASNLGQSLFSGRFQDRRAFFAAESGGAVGFVEGDHKFVYDLDSGDDEYYDLARDPLELDDVSGAHPERMARYAAVAREFAGAVAGYYQRAPLLDEDVGVSNFYAVAIETLQVRIDGEICPRSGPATEIKCTGLERPIRAESVRVRNRERRCLVVPVPATATLGIELRNPELLEMISGARVLVGSGGRAATNVVTRVSVDGEFHGETQASTSPENRLEFPRARESLVLELFRPPRRGPPPGAEICLDLLDYALDPGS